MNHEEIKNAVSKEIISKLPNQLDRLYWTREQIINHQEIELRRLIRHAKKHSKWYREKYHDINPEDLTIYNHSSLPVLTKSTLMENWDDIVCDPSINKKIAENHQRKLRDEIIKNPYYKDYYLFYSTGGSSGLRGLFVWTKDLVAEYASYVFRNEYKEDLEKKDKIKRVAALESPSSLHVSSEIYTVKYTENSEILNVPVTLPLETICNKLNRYNPTHITGFSSVIVQLAFCQLSGKLDIKPYRVSLNSEMIDGKGAEKIKEAWGVTYNMIWGSVEIAGGAADDKTHSGMILAEDYNIFDIVDNNYKTTDDINQVSRVLVTHFPNKILPLIRYEINDILELKKEYSNYRVLSRVIGRCDDYFSYKDGIKVHPMIFRHVLGQIPEIIEYQVHQTVSGADISIICSGYIDQAVIKAGLLRGLKEAGLNDPEIGMKIVEKIQRHSETAKFRRFIPLTSK
ncbi:MAG TPA: hypothetical protein QF753_09385 [Victivallales bacterium]|nr:hypothetical protein [Victivallales bacterium]